MDDKPELLGVSLCADATRGLVIVPMAGVLM